MRARWIALLFAASVATLAVAPVAADAREGDRYSMANDCWLVKSGAGFIGEDFTRVGKGAAARFFLKPTDLGKYLFYRQDRSFMDAAGPAVGAASTPSRSSEWVVHDGGPRFRISSLSEGRFLSLAGGELAVGGAAGRFQFLPAKRCTAYPEIEVNVSGTPSRGETSYGEVNGTMEGHMHHMAFEFLGGRVHCGRPWHRYGAPYALVDCPDHQVADGNIAILDNVLDHGTPTGSHSPFGWPHFTGWPTHSSLTHEQSYYRWVERVWRSGMRLYVNLLVENRVLCELYPYKKNDCNEMNSVRKQINDAYAYEDYVDAQAGGPGKGYYQIVRNPFEARKVINEGKLAVVLGMEVSEPFDCYLRNNEPQCTKRDIVRDLDELEGRGLRQFELVNKFDNALTGVAGDGGTTGVLTNFGNFYATGSWFRMDSCEDPNNADNDPLAVEHNNDDLLGAIIQAYLPPGAAPVYPDGPKCNQNGLTELGAFAVRELMRRGMLFDPDHMSALARSQALAVVEAKDYSGVMSSHSWATDDSYRRIWKLGGMVTPSTGTSTGFSNKYEHLMELRPKTKYYFGYGIGADQNGFAGQGGPREGGDAGPVRYPFRSPLDPAVTVHRQTSGTRKFDINTDGIAHYGLYPDWIEDLRKLQGPDIIRDLRRGAEAYLQTWERAIGIEEVNCRRSARNLSAWGTGDLRLGDRPQRMLRRAGQPERRTDVWTYCAQGKGARHGTVTAAFDQGRAALIASDVRAASAGGVEKGDGKAALRDTYRLATGLFAQNAGGSVYLYGVRAGRVRAVGVASASLSDDALRALADGSRVL